MKRLVIVLVALLAIFTAIRAYTQSANASGVDVAPGLVEVSDGRSSLGLGFGLLSSDGGRQGPWSVLPLVLQYRSGSSTVTLSLHGLSFLLNGGISLGRAIVIDRPTVGDVLSAGGPVTVAARLDGDVWVLGSDVTLTAKAMVTGTVVTIGGKVKADPKARVSGGVHRLAELPLPFVGVLGTRFSAGVLAFARGALLFVLAAGVLLLAAFYLPRLLAGIAAAASTRWRETLITVAVAAVAVPVATALLAVSVGGIFFLPFLALAMLSLAILGGLALCVRLGAWMRRGTGESPLFLFTSGLLGLFVVSLPGLAGVAAALFRGPAAAAVAGVLRSVDAVAALLLLAWGFGTGLAQIRAGQRKG
jgi:hypothetical protein